MSRRTAQAEPTSTLSIPRELWYPTPIHTTAVSAPKPRMPLLVVLLPAATAMGGYTSALACAAQDNAAASALLLLALAALVGLGWGVGRYAVAWLRYHRSKAQR